MRRIRPVRFGAAVTVLGLLALSACGTGNTPAAAPAPCERPVRIAQHEWVGYEANVAVVSYLLRTKLGCDVEIVVDTEEDSWPKLESGEVDVILEDWGHTELKRLYIDEKKVAVSAGPTGNKGIIGWYVPEWMAQEYPDIRDYRNLNKYAHLFATPDSGGKGRLLDSAESYVTNDKALVANLGLNFEVVYSGGEEATVKAALEAKEQRKPLLFYFWQPHWLFQWEFRKVELPPYKDGCDADPATVACDYPVYDLEKIASKSFADNGGRAYELVKNFTWNNFYQNEVAGYIAGEKLSHEQAAQKWLERYPDVWRSWIPA